MMTTYQYRIYRGLYKLKYAVRSAGAMEKNKRLTDEELQAIRERAEKATEAPWVVVTDELGGQAKAVIDGDNWDVIRRPYVGKDNAAFIAHAREDIPKLLAEIDYAKELLRKSYKNMISQENFQDESVHVEVDEYLNGGDNE